MQIQNSLDKALRQQGLQSINITQTAQMAWQTQERNALMSICHELNIDVQLNQERTQGRQHLSTAEYKSEKAKLEQDIELELQPLRDELQEYIDIKRDFETIAVQTTKIPLVKKVLVSESELQEVENQAKSYRAVRQQIDTLEKREETVAEKKIELQAKETELAEREKCCQKIEFEFDKMKKTLEKAEKNVKRYSSELSYKKNELIETTMELDNLKDELYDLGKKYNTLMKNAGDDCCLIRDFAIAMKMFLFSKNPSYKTTLTEEQENLIKSIINIAKEVLKKHNMSQSVNDIETKCGISSLILSEIKKLNPPKNQPMFSMDRVKSDEFKPTSETDTSYKKPIQRGR